MGYSERTKAVSMSSGSVPACTRSISFPTVQDKLQSALQQLKRMLSWCALESDIKLVVTPSSIIRKRHSNSAERLQMAMEQRCWLTSSLIPETMLNPLAAPACIMGTRHSGVKESAQRIAAHHIWISLFAPPHRYTMLSTPAWTMRFRMLVVPMAIEITIKTFKTISSSGVVNKLTRYGKESGRRAQNVVQVFLSLQRAFKIRTTDLIMPGSGLANNLTITPSVLAFRISPATSAVLVSVKMASQQICCSCSFCCLCKSMITLSNAFPSIARALVSTEISKLHNVIVQLHMLALHTSSLRLISVLIIRNKTETTFDFIICFRLPCRLDMDLNAAVHRKRVVGFLESDS